MWLVLLLLQVTFEGPGQQAGLRVGDVVLEVNGNNVAEKHLEEVIMLVEEGGRFLSVLVKEQTGGCPEGQEHTPSTGEVSRLDDITFTARLSVTTDHFLSVPQHKEDKYEITYM